MCIEPIIEDDRWSAAGLEPLAGRAAAATLTHFGLDPAAFEIALLACDDARIAVLNADCDTKQASAARPKCPSSSRATKYCNWRTLGSFCTLFRPHL